MSLTTKWTDEELHQAVETYLKMLKYQQNNTPFIKAHVNSELQGKIDRSRASIEMRFQNISYVLYTHKRPFVTGYLPLSNVGPTNEEKIWQLIQKLQPR